MIDARIKAARTQSYAASGSGSSLEPTTNREALGHRDALQRDWTVDDISRAREAGAITPLQRKVLSVDLIVDALGECLRDDKPVRDRHIAKAVNSTANAVSTARTNGIRKLINFLAS